MSASTEQLVAAMFAPEARGAAEALLRSRCTGSEFGIPSGHDELLVRLQYAAIKCSDGDVDALRRAIELAEVDWRDLLVAAEFDLDQNAHIRWYSTVVGS